MLHPVKFGSVWNHLKDYLQSKQSNIYVLVDTNTYHFCFPLISEFISSDAVVIIEAGENHKNLASCEKVWHFLSQKNADRHSILICLGGGVVCDLGGFCAATYKRGILSVLIPTTLLAMVDASIGGKTGIDFQYFKNQIGSFYLPEQVFIDPIFLNTLPARELQAGMAEMWKHLMIDSQEKAIQLFNNQIQLNSLEAIQLSVEIKMNLVTKDPKESGLRKQLNLGHTLGHAIESTFLESHQPLLHGEAVFAGLWLEQYCSFCMNILPEDQWYFFSNAILPYLPKLNLSNHDATILEFLKQDKKNSNDAVRFVILKELGNCIWDVNIDSEIILKALKNYPSD